MSRSIAQSPAQVIAAGYEHALHLIENFDADAISVAERDQIQAASADMSFFSAVASVTLATRGGDVGIDQDPSPTQWAKSLALIQYATVVCWPRRCAHITPSGPHQPLLFGLGPRIVTCIPCWFEMALRHVDEHPDACDWCHEPTRTFFPLVLHHAAATVHSDACERCAQELRAELPIAKAAA